MLACFINEKSIYFAFQKTSTGTTTTTIAAIWPSSCCSAISFWRFSHQHDERKRPWNHIFLLLLQNIMKMMGLKDQPLIFMLLLMSSWMIQKTHSNADCPEQCVCMWKSGKETTECINRYVVHSSIQIFSFVNILWECTAHVIYSEALFFWEMRPCNYTEMAHNFTFE